VQSFNNGLDDGEPVEFDLYQEGDRLLAVNVTAPNGQNLRGSKYAAGMVPGGGQVAAGGSAVPATKVFRRRKLTNN
jgi:hypothetical protein